MKRSRREREGERGGQVDGLATGKAGSPTRLGKSLLHRGRKTERREKGRQRRSEGASEWPTKRHLSLSLSLSLPLLSILDRPTNRATDLTGLCVCKSSIPRGISLFERSVRQFLKSTGSVYRRSHGRLESPKISLKPNGEDLFITYGHGQRTLSPYLQ